MATFTRALSLSAMAALLVAASVVPTSAYTRIFLDSFTHGTSAGDADWSEVQGDWFATAAKGFSADPLRANLAVNRRVTSFSRGRIKVKVKLAAPAAGANASVLFHYLDPTRYRYVTVSPTRLLVGQKGTIKGTPATVIANVPRVFTVGVSYRITVDVLLDGLVEVRVNAEAAPVAAPRFATPAGGRLGLRLSKSRAVFDDYAVYRPAAAPPASPLDVAASDGAFADRIRVSWSASTGAYSYKVFRGVANDPASSTLVGTALVPPFDDVSPPAEGVPAFYWVVAGNEAGYSGLGTADSGYALSTAAPVVSHVDPPHFCFGAPSEATVYVRGLSAANYAADVRLISSDGLVEHVLPFSAPSSPQELVVALPSPPPASGTWDLRVTARNGLSGVLPAAVALSDAITVSLAGLEGGTVAASGGPSGIRILAANPPPPGGEGFIVNPRAYVRPAAPGAAATALAHVLLENAATLTASVPGGLAPGSYDVFVANPGGGCGVLSGGLTVVSGPLPTITKVQPDSWDAGSASQAVAIHGDHFVGGLSVSMECRSAGGDLSFRSGAAGTVSTDTVEATFDLSSLAPGTVCVVAVTNPDGGRAGAPAVALKSPGAALNAWSAAGPMVEARRGPVLAAAGSADSVHLYAIGGDAAEPSATVESAPLDRFGQPGSWNLQPHSLPAARVFAGGAAIGNFVYVLGGSDGLGATGSVYRAEVLTTAKSPEVAAAIHLDESLGGGLAAGVWYYRAAAVFAAADPFNPGGESLPGAAVATHVPALPDFAVRLAWSPVQGAVGYRVYRTPTPGVAYGEAELLAELDGAATTTFIDTGAVATAPARPIAPGSLGVWHAVAAMNTARESHAVVAVPDPGAAGSHFLYAAGGRSSAGDALGSIEYCTVTEAGDISPWVTASGALGAARADLGGWAVDSGDATWVVVGPGRTTLGFERAVEAFPVVADGSVGAPTPTDPTPGDYAGYAAFGGAGNLFLAGGGGGAPGTSVIATDLCPAGPGCSGPPDLEAWNQAGASLGVARAYPGFAQKGVFLFLAGGFDGVGATSAVETTTR